MESIGLLLALVGFLMLIKDTGEDIKEIVTETRLEPLYRKHANKQGLDWRLLKAIAIVESSENPNARNPADPSTGLMQVLCVPDGSGGCKNRFNVQGWEGIRENDLLDPDINLGIASQILAWNIQRYGFNKGIAVYNSWSARNDPMEGPFQNQGYVDKVLRHYNAIKGDNG